MRKSNLVFKYKTIYIYKIRVYLFNLVFYVPAFNSQQIYYNINIGTDIVF